MPAVGLGLGNTGLPPPTGLAKLSGGRGEFDLVSTVAAASSPKLSPFAFASNLRHTADRGMTRKPFLSEDPLLLLLLDELLLLLELLREDL